MTSDEARALLAEAKFTPGVSDTGDLALQAERIGTHREQPGDREAAELRQLIKTACRVLRDETKSED